MITKPGTLGLSTLLLLTLLIGSFTERAEAGSPWLWDRVLKQDMVSDAMRMPTALYIDTGKGIYYIVDSGKNRILSFGKDGDLLKIFNAGKALNIPYDMVKTNDKGVWVVERGRNALSYIDLKEKTVTPHTLHYQGILVYPDKIESKGEELFVLDKATGNILSYSTALKENTLFSCPQCPKGFVDFKIHNQKIWALDQANKTIRCFSLDGALVKTFPLDETVIFPVSLDIGPNGFIYVLDRQRRDIAVYDKNGVFKYRFLQRGITRGQLYYPTEIRFDPWGRLCVVDEGNAKVAIYKR
jgi:DNA-binding beta-propeller fold protein YncE